MTETTPPATPQSVAESLVVVGEMLAPIFEFAEGQRARLLHEGWSPTAAEQISSVILMHMLQQALTGRTS